MASRTGSGKAAFWTAVFVAAAAIAVAPSSLLAQSAKKGAPAKAVAKAEPPKPVAFVAPPRTISDITAILDSEKPDPDKIAKLTADAEAPPPKLPPLDLAEWHYKRGQARGALGRTNDAIADAELAVKLGQGDDYADGVSRYEQFLIRQLRAAGERKRALDLIAKQQRAFANQSKGRNFWLNLATGTTYLTMGDFARAAASIERNRALLREAQGWPNNNLYIESYLSNVEEGAARLAEARGQFAAAEQSYRRCSSNMTIALSKSSQWPSAPPKEGFKSGIDWCLALAGRVEAKQGRVAQAEADVRRALLSRLSKSGKYHPDTAGILGVLVYVAAGAGPLPGSRAAAISGRRYPQGVRGYADDAQSVVNANLFVAQLLNLQRRYNDAGRKYDEVEQQIAKWEPSCCDFAMNGLSCVNTLLNMGRAADALVIAQKSFERDAAKRRQELQYRDVARFCGKRAGANGRTEEALVAFKSLPVILNVSGGTDDEFGVTAAAAESRTRGWSKAICGRFQRRPTGRRSSPKKPLRWPMCCAASPVQRALQASSARAAAHNPALAELVRKSRISRSRSAPAVGLAQQSCWRCPPGEARREGGQAPQAEIDTAAGRAPQTPPSEIAKNSRNYAEPGRAPAAGSPTSRRRCAPTRRCCRSISDATTASSGRCRKTAGRPSPRIAADARATSIPRSPSCARRSSRRPRWSPTFRRSTSRSRYELYALLLKPVEAGWKPPRT